MTRTAIRFTLSALAITAIIAISASPAWAPVPVCPNCVIQTKTTWAITPSEMMRICLVGLVTSPPSAAIDWEIAVFEADGATLLSKEARVPQQGFSCVDTTAEELRLTGLEPEPSGRLQFGLQITPKGWGRQITITEKLSVDGDAKHSVETINMLSGETTNSHRFSSAADLVLSNFGLPRNFARCRSVHGRKSCEVRP